MPVAQAVCGSSAGLAHSVAPTVVAAGSGVGADHVAGVDNSPTVAAEPMLASTGAAPTPAVAGAAAPTSAPPPTAPPTSPATPAAAAVSRVWL
ncbi:hypothetical protein MAHJHV53_29390 [Mycobacterium avium subsp. hominissuis]|nr:hypothetical protein BJP76_06035 [Mycobacterium avium subsp. hominissuis]BAN30282.1 hypothetical protein MAH_1208 [Mycobacterium avium subsp. hominissuis TH135]